MIAQVHWPFGNGKHLTFDVYTFDADWNDVAGLYIFTYLNGDYWRPLYVGETESFSSRLPNHERLNEAIRKGATHIHALAVKQQAQRYLWEQMLIQNLQPPMNAQHRETEYGLHRP